MPIYDFTCSDCGIEEERLSSIAARELQECKSCGARMQVKVSAPTIVSGVRDLNRVVPDGFKTVLKSIKDSAPRGKDDVPIEMKAL